MLIHSQLIINRLLNTDYGMNLIAYHREVGKNYFCILSCLVYFTF